MEQTDTQLPHFSASQSMMHTQIVNTVLKNLSFLHTGNALLDIIISTFLQASIIGIVGSGFTQIGAVLQYLRSLITSTWLYCIPIMALIRRQLGYKRKIIRFVDIPYFSDNRQINELYKAVYWFLTTNKDINYLHEPYMQYVFDKKITLDTSSEIKKDLSILKVLTGGQSKDIVYNGHTINYYLKTELITVYTDKDRKRENYKITLQTSIDETETIDILEQFTKHCITEYINNLSSSTWTQLIYTNNGNEWKSTPSNNSRKLDTIILKSGLKEKILEDFNFFLQSEEWYKERDLSYTRGYLWYGNPGTGKTSMNKALSLAAKRHIHYLILSEVESDKQLLELLGKINYSETILIIEDIDATLKIVKSRSKEEDKRDSDSDRDSHDNGRDSRDNIHDRDRDRDRDSHDSGHGHGHGNGNGNVRDRERRRETENKLTLGGLLNALSGIFNYHGRLLIMTSNHPEELDDALIRAGRIDVKYMFDNCDKEQIDGIYRVFFNQAADPSQLQSIKHNTYSPAHISSVFMRYRNNPNEALLHLDDDETKLIPFNKS